MTPIALSLLYFCVILTISVALLSIEIVISVVTILFLIIITPFTSCCLNCSERNSEGLTKIEANLHEELTSHECGVCYKMIEAK